MELTKTWLRIAALLVFLLVFMGIYPSLALALTISNLQVTNITSSSATVTWTTDQTSDSQVTYLPYPPSSTDTQAQAYGNQGSTSHTVQLTGLVSNQDYVFAASSMGANSELVWSEDTFFKTLAATAQTNTTSNTTNNQTTTNTTSNNQATGLQYSDLINNSSQQGGLQYSDLIGNNSTGSADATYNQAQVGLYGTGTIAKSGSTLYFLMNKDKVKVPFTTWEAYTGLGYGVGDILSGLDLTGYRTATSYFLSSASQEHPWGSCLKSGQTVYYSHSTGMIGIPTMAVLNSLGCKVLEMNAADKQILNTNPNLPVLQVGDSRLL